MKPNKINDLDGVVRKWRPTGLLEGLDENLEKRCADDLEYTAQLLINDYNWDVNSPNNDNKHEIDELYNEQGCFSGFILPLVRIMYGREFPIQSPMWLYYDFKKYMKENVQLLKALNTGIAQDAEVEFINIYVEKLVERLK